jgi:hypothetical protein
MAQVIIFTNENGGVSVCVPTGELHIDAVKAKDTPSDSIIVDSSTLPEADGDFFNAWELNGTTVSVNMTKAIAYQQSQLNSMAKAEASHRATNTGAGISNKLSDTDWLALLTTARTAIAAATTTQNLRDAVAPVQAAITTNA